VGDRPSKEVTVSSPIEGHHLDRSGYDDERENWQNQGQEKATRYGSGF